MHATNNFLCLFSHIVQTLFKQKKKHLNKGLKQYISRPNIYGCGLRTFVFIKLKINAEENIFWI